MNYYFESHVQNQLSSHSREICFCRPTTLPIPGLKISSLFHLFEQNPQTPTLEVLFTHFYNNFPIINDIDDGGCPIFPLSVFTFK